MHVHLSRRATFAATVAAERTLRVSAEAAEGTARLVGGSADPVGTWEYGRLEIVFGGFWTTLSENNDQALGRRGAEVACRSLGYAAGAQMYAGNASPLRGDGVDARAAGALACTGEEETLAECDGFSTRRGPFEDASIRGGIYDVVVMCTNPSGTPEVICFPCATRVAQSALLRITV